MVFQIYQIYPYVPIKMKFWIKEEVPTEISELPLNPPLWDLGAMWIVKDAKVLLVDNYRRVRLQECLHLEVLFFGYQNSTQRKFWSECADTQSDPSFCFAHILLCTITKTYEYDFDPLKPCF